MMRNVTTKLLLSGARKRSMRLTQCRCHSSLITDPWPSHTLDKHDISSWIPTSRSVPDSKIIGLPTKHSIKQLPPTILDMVQLTDLAAEIMETEIGRLYKYDEYAFDTDDDATTRDAAWDAADVAVQKVESAIRGFSYLIPGTIWNRWLSKGQNDTTSISGDIPPSDLLTLQQQLVDRLIDESHAYMTIRATHMEENYGKKGAVIMEGNFDQFGNRINETSTNPKRLDINMTNKSQEEEEEDSYMYDFAFPGPTTAMYDTMLDALACTAANTSNRQDTLRLALHYHEVTMARHANDGGDDLNDNVHTRPTAVSFNALIRVAAELPYDNSVNISTATAPVNEVQYRDEAISTFIGTVHEIYECGVVERNSATFKYGLDCVAKYFPPSRMRGNISTGLFQQARYECLINDAVIASYIAANTPSNDDWNDQYIRDKLQPGQWPVKWKRESRKRQYNPRDIIY